MDDTEQTTAATGRRGKSTAPPPEPEPRPVLDRGVLAGFANQIVENPAFLEAIDRAMNRITADWRNTEPGQAELREQHWRTLKALDAIQDELRRMRAHRPRTPVGNV